MLKFLLNLEWKTCIGICFVFTNNTQCLLLKKHRHCTEFVLMRVCVCLCVCAVFVCMCCVKRCRSSCITNSSWLGRTSRWRKINNYWRAGGAHGHFIRRCTQINIFCMKIETYLLEKQCRLFISFKYTLHSSEQDVTCG